MQRRRQPVIDLPFKRPGNLPRRRSEAADIDLADIQGNVLRGYTYPDAPRTSSCTSTTSTGRAR